MNSATADLIYHKIRKNNEEDFNFEAYNKLAEQVLKNEDIHANSFFEKHKVNINATTNNIKLKDKSTVKTIKVKFVAKEHREKRREIHNKMRKSIMEASAALNEGNTKVYQLKYCKENPNRARDLVGFFGNRFEPPVGSLSGSQVLERITNKNVGLDRKVQLFSKYLDEMFNEFEKLNTPCSDEEFAEKFPKLRLVAHGLMGDDVASNFKKYAGCSLPEDIEKKYNEYKRIAQSAHHMLDGRARMIGDPFYTYMTTSNYEKLASSVSLEDMACEGMENKGLDIPPNKGTIAAGAFIGTKNLFEVHPSTLDLFQRRGIISENVTFARGTEPISKKEAADAMAKFNFVGVIDNKTGKMKAVSVNRNFNPVVVDISEKFDKKQAYQNMLNELNKGTGTFIRSSDEYRNMRSALSNLIAGKGNEQELLKSLRENSDKYLENFYSKDKPSKVAINRRQCVINMVEQLGKVEPEVAVGEALRQYKEMNKELLANSNKGAVNIAPDQVNSSRELFAQQQNLQINNVKVDSNLNEQSNNVNMGDVEKEEINVDHTI